MQQVQYDPITLRVIWDRLVGICQDAAATMVRTTFSPIVREGNDYCCSLIDMRGRQLAEPPHTLPSFTGTLPITVRHFVERFPLEELRPGDSIVTNDTWLGTGHLNDFNIATPVFDKRGKMIAWASCTAHMTDIGGTINVGATRDIHEEGLRLPISRIAREGRLNEDLLELIRWNVRMPDQCIGDLMGMMAANATMSNRLLALVDEAGLDDLPAMSDEILSRSEDAMRVAIAELPNGRHQGSVTFNGVGFDVTIKAAVEVSDNEVSVDFAGTSSQDTSAAINVCFNYTYAYTVYPLKLLVHPRLPSNDGCLRPFKVSAPEGSILNSRYPVAGYSRNFVGHMIHAALFSAFAGIAPDRIWAHSGSAPTGPEALSGQRPDEKQFVHLFFQAGGGTGAMPNKDGEICYFPTNCRSTSVESTEALAPVLFECKEIIPDSAGPGRYRGGLGGRWRIKNIGKVPAMYSGMVGRLNYPPKGLLGGKDAHTNRLFLNGNIETRGFGRWELQPGETFTKENPGGGGLHSPLTREPERVLEDVLEGYVSLSSARDDYGVIVQDGIISGFTEPRKAATKGESIAGKP